MVVQGNDLKLGLKVWIDNGLLTTEIVVEDFLLSDLHNSPFHSDVVCQHLGFLQMAALNIHVCIVIEWG